MPLLCGLHCRCHGTCCPPAARALLPACCFVALLLLLLYLAAGVARPCLACLPACLKHCVVTLGLMCREVFAQSRVRVNIRRIRMALMGVRRFHRKFEAIKVGAASGAV
jgi:hypothetical protein